MSFIYGPLKFESSKDKSQLRCSRRSGRRIRKTGFVLYRGMAFYKFVTHGDGYIDVFFFSKIYVYRAVFMARIFCVERRK